MADDSRSAAPAINMIIPQNLTAAAQENVVGNPPSTRPESGVGNCYPGLEYDHRNLDRRFFPGLLVDFVAAGTHQGIRVAAVAANDPGLLTPPAGDKELRPKLQADLAALAASKKRPWFVNKVSQGDTHIELRDDTGPLDGATCWRLIRSLRPGRVTLELVTRPESAAAPAKEPKPEAGTKSGSDIKEPCTLAGWRRIYTDPTTGVIDTAYRPGELTQSLCSPWTHDFRDCACTYWASSRPDIVKPAIAPGVPTQPGGLAAQWQNELDINWLRNPDFPDMLAQPLPTQAENRPYETSYYQINQQWQNLAVVLEGHETSGLYVPRTQKRDQAPKFETPEELRKKIVELAGLEHVVALLYLYAYSSVITPEEAVSVAAGGNYRFLERDVTFMRRTLRDVAIGEMQHLRAVNLLLWKLDEAHDQRSDPTVTPPARTLPQDNGNEIEAKLKSLTPDTVQTFIELERSSAYIDGQYSQVTATLMDSEYPPRLFELASTIADEGEEHFLKFTRIKALIDSSYPTHHVYLRDIREANQDKDKERVEAALAIYKKICDDLTTGYKRGNLMNQEKLATSRSAMFDLYREAERLAKEERLGIPYLDVRW